MNMKKKRQIVISVLGMTYIKPIIDLYTKLDEQKFEKFSRTKVSLNENGYSTSTIVLSILMVESIINRVKYLEKKNKIENVKFFSDFCKDSKLVSHLTELYVIRDIIVHNHLWSVSYEFDEKYNEKKIYQKLLEGYGSKRGKRSDWKYKNYVDIKNKVTKNLKLNIVPMNIGKEDVIKIFKVLKNLLKYLEEKELSKTNKIYFPITGFHYKFKNEDLDFFQILEKITKY